MAETIQVVGALGALLLAVAALVLPLSTKITATFLLVALVFATVLWMLT